MQSEISSALDEWCRILGEGNLDGLVSLYAQDGILQPTVQAEICLTHDDIRQYFAGLMGRKVTVELQKIWVNSYGDIGKASGYYVFRLDGDDGPVELPARFTFIFQKQKDRWMIIEQHSSAVPAK